MEDTLKTLVEEVALLRKEVVSFQRENIDKYNQVKEENASLLQQLNLSHTEKAQLLTEKLQVSDQLNNKVLELTEQNALLNARSLVKIGQEGELQLLQILNNALPWCSTIDTHDTAHSGDLVIDVPRAHDTIRILLDRKNYKAAFVSGEHLDTAIRDARCATAKLGKTVDAILLVYNNLPKKYGDGFCEDLEVATKYQEPFHPNNVMAATIHNVVGAILKLATHSIVHIETQEGSKRMQDFSLKYAQRMTNFFQESAPFWDLLNITKLKTAADEMQKGIVMTKRLAAAPPYQTEKKPILDAVSIFEEGRKNEYILGGQLVAKIEASNKKRKIDQVDPRVHK